MGGIMDQQNTDHQKDRFRRYLPVLYGCVIAAMLLLVLLDITMKSKAGANYGLGSFVSLDNSMKTAEGVEFHISQIDSLRRNGSGEILLTYQLPDTLSTDTSLVFRTKNCLVNVWVGDQKDYTTDITEAPFYNHSPGTRWNVVPISKSEAGGIIRIVITQAYQDGRAKLDHFYLGDRAAILLNIVESQSVGLILSLLILFVGFTFFSAWVVLNWRRRPKNNSLLWLAVFSFAAGVWCLLETNLFQLFSQNLRLLEILDDMMLVIGGMPIYLYLDATFQVFRSRTVRWLCGLDLGYLALATAFEYLNLWDYHQTLDGAVATYGIVAVILVVCVFRHQHETSREELEAYSDPYEKHRRLFKLLQMVGILMLGLGLLGDLLRYLTADVMDRAFIIRIGLLLFILFFGLGNIYQMIVLVEKGRQADFISKLAYSDGLTGLGNRTAYIEYLRDRTEKAPAGPLGIVMFDINNLKQVNDTMGHKLGDEMICTCADLLRESFGKKARLYRVGGDEYIALLEGENNQEKIRETLRSFDECTAKWNAQPGVPFQLVVAVGTAFTDSADKDALERAEKEADLAMYKNKYTLKKQSVSAL